MYYVYMLRCKDNSIYTGITTNLERRIKEHKSKGEKCAKYTLTHPVVKLEKAWVAENRAQASKLEYFIKHLSKNEKENLIKGETLKTFLNEEFLPFVIKNEPIKEKLVKE